MTGLTDLDFAEARAAEERTRLGVTLETLQARLTPQAIAREAIDGIAGSGGKAIEAGIDTARRHPGKVAGALALAAALLARRRIIGLFDRKTGNPAKPAAPRRVRNTVRPPTPTERISE